MTPRSQQKPTAGGVLWWLGRRMQACDWGHRTQVRKCASSGQLGGDVGDADTQRDRHPHGRLWPRLGPRARARASSPLSSPVRPLCALAGRGREQRGGGRSGGGEEARARRRRRRGRRSEEEAVIDERVVRDGALAKERADDADRLGGGEARSSARAGAP